MKFASNEIRVDGVNNLILFKDQQLGGKMMKRLSIIFSMVFLLSVSVSSHGANVWITDVGVVSVHVMQSGTFRVLPDVPVFGCNSGELTARVTTDTNPFTIDAWKAALSMLLSAATLGKRVDLMYKDNTGNCYLRQVVIVF